MMRLVLPAFIVTLLALVFGRVLLSYEEQTALRPLAESYVKLVPQDLNTANIITGILMTYRGLDTLGEVAVLFMVAASLGLLLPQRGTARADRPSFAINASEIVQTGRDVLLPLIIIFGAYVILNGHVSAGGGFQGGAIVASGVMLMLLARRDQQLNLTALSVIEAAAGVFFVLLALAGLLWAGGFLDPRFLPAGELGAFVSGGAIPVISALLGVKVGAELSVLIDRFRT